MKSSTESKKNEKPELVFNVINALVVLGLVLLPFYLFNGRLSLGGDDTRFYYAYPSEFLKSLTLYSWNNISSLPYYIPNHHWIPFVAVLTLLERILGSKILLE